LSVPGFMKRREAIVRQRQQRGAFHLFKQLADLLFRGAVNPRVGDVRLPVQQVVVLVGQAAKLVARQGIILGVFHAVLDLAFVLGRVRFGGKEGRRFF